MTDPLRTLFPTARSFPLLPAGDGALLALATAWQIDRSYPVDFRPGDPLPPAEDPFPLFPPPEPPDSLRS
jgi:hypothetical protein